MTVDNSRMLPVRAWPVGEPRCENPGGCPAEANFIVNGRHLCWDHMRPLKEAGETVRGMLKFDPST